MSSSLVGAWLRNRENVDSQARKVRLGLIEEGPRGQSDTVGLHFV